MPAPEASVDITEVSNEENDREIRSGRPGPGPGAWKGIDRERTDRGGVPVFVVGCTHVLVADAP
eukprot:2497002-Rhodomonas_salina.3